MAAIDSTKKSGRFLQSRRYTHDTFTDAQEAFTSVLDINASEIYIDHTLIPSSGLPYNSSGQDGSIYSSSGQQVMKYYYRQTMTKSDTNNEVWFFLVPTGSTSGVGAGLINGSQQINFISPKYSISSLANSNTEDATPGYGVKVLVNGVTTQLSAGEFQEFSYVNSEAFFVSADKGICVAQYTYAQNGVGEPNGNRGDPDMVILNPVEQNINDVTVFQTPKFNIKQQYVNVIIKDQGVASFKINGSAPNSSFIKIQNSSYSTVGHYEGVPVRFVTMAWFFFFF